MSPSISTPDHHHPLPDRPLKRPRKAPAPSTHPLPDQPFTNAAPVDHIFIADGVINKKPVKKAPLSCCECRRLKLKCDRNFPCASCKKRGCAEICPDGVLVSGKGTRFILANTEQLHSKIHEMSERIRSLEDALQKLHAEKASNTHPLMHPDLLGIKSTMGLYSGGQSHNDAGPSSRTDTGGHQNGRAPEGQMEEDRGERGSSEDVDMAVDHPTVGERREFKQENETLASEVLRLSHAFPLPENVNPEPNIPMRSYIRSQLPPREEADYLWEQARHNAMWQYNPHPSSTFFPNLAHHCYTASAEELNPRRLALLYMVLAVGCLVDLKYRPADSPDAEKFHQLARASLCEIPVMEETNVETITALFYEIWYLLVFSDKKKAAGYAWGLMGLTAKLAQSIGLHRNGGKSKVIPEEVEKRRSLFWELLYLDARLSLSLGRPPSLSINHMDCQRPSYTPDDDCIPSESLHHYQEWKHSCYLHCLAPVLDAISKPSLEYTTVLDLDKAIRDFSIPAPLRQKELFSRSLIMQKASLSTVLEAVLLQLHRTFFTRALSGPEEAFNRRHKYAPSVVAVFLSASRMIATVQDLYHREPQLTARILGYWSNAFSAAVALCLLVSRAPFTCLSPAALQELERARILFKSAKDTCPRALQVIPILETMIDKANYIYNRWSNGQELPTIVLQHITDEFAVDSDVSPSGGSANYVPNNGPENSQPLSPTQVDSFRFTHRSLSQCIVEAHQRAKSLFPMRKPCNCSVALAKDCPPSHSWAPPPSVPQQTSPVLPEVPPALTISMGAMSPSANSNRASPAGHGVSPVPSSSPARVSSSPALSDGYGLYSAQVLPGDGPAIPPPPVPSLLSPTSKMAVVDTLNFELGALNSHSDQSWMAFF